MPDREKVFLDANVLFTAAHNPEGKAAFVIETSRHGRWDVVTSDLAVQEAVRNLENKYPQCLIAFEKMVRVIKIIPSGDGSRCVLELPQKDRPIFEAALHCGATHLLTGDLRDFGRYMNKPQYGVVIQTVSDFLAGYRAKRSL
jgi:predicted nucleic acid-binding protein